MKVRKESEKRKGGKVRRQSGKKVKKENEKRILERKVRKES